MSEEIKERARAAAARILGTLPGCTTCLEAAGIIARLTRERDEARDRIAALEAQLTTRGACECGDDEVCALARRAQEAERELDRVRVDLVTAQHAIGEGWFAGVADTATAIERKCAALEGLADESPAAAGPAAAMALRPEVAVFAQEMERKLRKHDATRGERGWKTGVATGLLHRLKEEELELRTAVYRSRPAAEILAEAADVANLAMMVADVCGGLASPTATAGEGERDA